MGEYSFSAHPQSWSKKLCRWGFLGVKIALLLPIAYFASLDLTYSFYHDLFAGICDDPSFHLVYDLHIRLSLGGVGSAAALSDMSPTSGASGTGWLLVTELPRMEWN